jgi:hypothetical protein
MAMYYFLLVYSRGHQGLQTVQRFEDQADAGRAYEATERAAHGNPDLEVVLVGADSIDTIRQTHGQYFDAPPDGSKYLDAVSAR